MERGSRQPASQPAMRMACLLTLILTLLPFSLMPFAATSFRPAQ